MWHKCYVKVVQQEVEMKVNLRQNWAEYAKLVSALLIQYLNTVLFTTHILWETLIYWQIFVWYTRDIMFVRVHTKVSNTLQHID